MVETTSSLKQKAQVFDRNPTMNLIEACSLENGILRFDDAQQSTFASNAFSDQKKYAFFIPASGSGSRMFDELYRFMESSVHTEGSRKFFEVFRSMAIYHSLDASQKKRLEEMSEQEIAELVLSPAEMNLLQRPKGLIPFHITENSILNAFQEHVLQAKELFQNEPSIHFTLQDGYQEEVKESIAEKVDETLIHVEFSTQDRATDAFCFDENRNLIAADGFPLRRPAGHGSLLVNLNDMDADVVLIKNIDNVQHISKSQRSNETWKMLMGVLEQFENELRNLREEYSDVAFQQLNERYKLFPSSEELSKELLEKVVARPTRICGMVLNQGAPGGGPFWIEKSGEVTKQIVEKVQISSTEDQQKIMTESSHFNPVMIVASKNDLDGNRLNLHNFANDEQYLVVKKPYNGKTIYYRELPGLWNGGMYHWNTLFVEIPSEVFSPVKTVLDLTADEHQAD